MKYQDLYAIAKGAESFKGANVPFKLGYMVVKNARLAQAELKNLEDAIKPSEGLEAAESDRVECVKRFAKKGEDGQFELRDGPRGQEFVIPEEARQELNKALGEILVKHKDVYEAREKAVADYSRMLEEELPEPVMSKFHRISKNDIANEKLPFEAIEVWSELVD